MDGAACLWVSSCFRAAVGGALRKQIKSRVGPGWGGSGWLYRNASSGRVTPKWKRSLMIIPPVPQKKSNVSACESRADAKTSAKLTLLLWFLV